jgi:hypothetical protein
MVGLQATVGTHNQDHTDQGLLRSERGAFNALIAERPVIAVRLLANLARELSFRLRNATRMISELER